MKLCIEEGGEAEVKHVNIVRARGKLYAYHRPSGKPLAGVREQDGRLIAPRSTLDLLRRLNAPRCAARPGSLGGLFDAFRQTRRWRDYQQRTRSDYETVFAWLAPSRGGRLHDLPLVELSPALVVSIRDRAHAAKGWRFADYVLSGLSVTCEWARAKGLMSVNPCTGVARVCRPRNAPHLNRRWDADEIEAVLVAARARAPQLVLPILIARFTGMRQGDVLALAPDAWDGRALRWRARKNGAEVTLAPPPQILTHALEAARQGLRQGQRKLCLNAFAAPWAQNGSGFRASFFKLIRALEREGKVRSGLTFHGLRHTVGVELAEAGASEETIKALLGNVSNAALRVYLRSARKSFATQRGVALLDALSAPLAMAA